MLNLHCFLFVVVLCCSVAALKKCCPYDEGVLIAGANGTGSHEFKCIKALDNNETAVNKTLHPLRVGKKDLNLSYGFPDGCQYSMHSYSRKEKIASEHCIDKIFADELLNGTLVIAKGHVKVFGCDAEQIQKPSLTTIAKCCLGNMVYDTEHHLCINRQVSEINGTIRLSSNEGLFERFVEGESDLLDIKYGPPYCPPSKAMYSYVHKFYDIEMTNDKLILNRSSHGENFVLEPGTFCVDETHDGVLVVRGCREPYKGTPRVFKCCPEGYIYGFPELNCKGTPVCVPNTDWGVTFDFYDLSDMKNVTSVSQPDVMGISYTINCVKKFKMDNENPVEIHYLNKENGNIVAPNHKELHPKYCMDTYKPNCGDQKPQPLTLSCFPDLVDIQKIRNKLLVYSVGLAISSIFLAVTLLVYIALPPLRNLHGKTIMCHVASMLVASSCLARVQWTNVAEGYCIVLGYIIYFSFLAAFSWLNVMCFDIWWTFANVRTMQTIRQDKDFIRFLRYSLYAWGVPIVLTTTTLLLDIYNVAPTWLDPNFGEPQCWINTSSHKAPLLILFTLPVGLQIVANLVFFILTALYCNKVKSEIHRMQAGSMGERCRRRFSADKNTYTINLKLFVVMGISWILEIISSLVSEPIELWYVTDAINVLQGIPIFCILVLKKKIFHLMKRRLGSKKASKRPSLEDPKLLSCLDKILRPRSDITMTTGVSSTSSEGRKSLPWRKSETGLNGLLLTKANENGKSP